MLVAVSKSTVETQTTSGQLEVVVIQAVTEVHNLEVQAVTEVRDSEANVLVENSESEMQTAPLQLDRGIKERVLT